MSRHILAAGEVHQTADDISFRRQELWRTGWVLYIIPSCESGEYMGIYRKINYPHDGLMGMMGWVSIATNKLASFVCGHREYSQLIYCRWGKAYNDHLLWASAPYTANACWKCIFFPCWKWMCMFLAYIGNVCAKVQILFAWLSIKETLALLYQTSHPFTTRLIMLQVRMVRLQFDNCVSQTQYSCNDNSDK